MVLFAHTVVIAARTVVPDRATRLQGTVTLVMLATFMFLGEQPMSWCHVIKTFCLDQPPDRHGRWVVTRIAAVSHAGILVPRQPAEHRTARAQSAQPCTPGAPHQLSITCSTGWRAELTAPALRTPCHPLARWQRGADCSQLSNFRSVQWGLRLMPGSGPLVGHVGPEPVAVDVERHGAYRSL